MERDGLQIPAFLGASGKKKKREREWVYETKVKDGNWNDE